MKKFSRLLLGVLVLTVLAIASVPVHAATTPTSNAPSVSSSGAPWFPLVPCGLNAQPAGIDKSVHDYTQDCNQCLLVELGKNVIDMVFYAIVPAVGTLMFMIAGFIILFSARSGNSGGVGKGKEIMTNTAIGIAIIFSAWLITNFILKSLTNDQVSSAPWYQIQCRVGSLKDLADATVPSIGTTTTTTTGGAETNYNCSANATCETLPTGQVGTYSGATALSDCKQQCEGVTSPTGPTGPTGNGVQCLQSGLNLCQGDSSQGCANTDCNQYATMISNQATGLATPAVLKAFMEIESSCHINATSADSYGLMQIKPGTANIYASRCGLDPTITQAWLNTPANAEKSICIAAQYINAIGQSQCGTSPRNLYAGYNGGQTGDNSACAPSVSCAGETSCSGEPVKRWECLYEDKAKMTCNGGTSKLLGYNPTRQGATKIQYCSTNPGF